MSAYVMDSVTSLEKYPNVTISESGSWMDASDGPKPDDD